MPKSGGDPNIYHKFSISLDFERKIVSKTGSDEVRILNDIRMLCMTHVVYNEGFIPHCTVISAVNKVDMTRQESDPLPVTVTYITNIEDTSSLSHQIFSSPPTYFMEIGANVLLWIIHVMWHTSWSCLIRYVNMKWIQAVLWNIQSGHDSVHRRTDGRTFWREPSIPPFNEVERGYNKSLI